MSLPVSGLHTSGPLGEPQPGMLPLPGADCPDQGLQWHHRLGSQPCSQHTHLVPDPRSAISPDVTGCLRLHPTPQGRGLLLSPLHMLGPGPGFPGSCLGPGCGVGPGQHSPGVWRREYPRRKTLMERNKRTNLTKSSADKRFTPPLPSPVNCLKTSGSCSPRIPTMILMMV